MITAHDSPLPAVSSDSFLLIPHTVRDLNDFTDHHEKYLVSVFDEPERAAELWRQRLKRSPYGDEGFVALRHYGRDVIRGDLWDQVSGIWLNLIELAADFIRFGVAESSFPGQPTPMRLRLQRKTVLLTINEDTTVVEPYSFFPGLLDEAERYFRWVVDSIGTDAENLATVRRIRDGLDLSGFER